MLYCPNLQNSSRMDVDVDQQGPESGVGGLRRDSTKRVTFAKSIAKSPCNAQVADNTPEPAPKSTAGTILPSSSDKLNYQVLIVVLFKMKV